MKIKTKADKVNINDFEFYGYIDWKQFCSNCKFCLVYYEDFDAYFCPKCNRWTESKCSDPSCKYCPNRLEVPLPNR